MLDREDIAGQGDGFSRVDDDPGRYRCYGMRTLERTLERPPGRDVPALPQPVAADRTLTLTLAPSEDLPMSGQQEIHFFGSDFGVVISDLGFTRDFDYEFVHEEVSFYQFRLEGRSIERASARHDPVLVRRPGFRFGPPPAGHNEHSVLMASSRWRTVTPFVGAETAERLFGGHGGLAEADQAFRGWRMASGSTVLGLSGEMLPVLDSMLACRFEGAVRRAYLEAKTVELMCLALDRLRGDGGDSWTEQRLTARDQGRLEAARELLDAQFENPPTLAEIGRMVGLNRRKLALGFRSQFGTSVLQYCLTQRMRMARDLLEQGQAIALVAQRTGYSDQASFSRAFRRHHGATPGRFSQIQ
ncbi:helix-turn-helix domain-containing protein [Sphingomonas canadensis]|uniref:Helix-turn-helix domain-containing protein n=1 Tax=Sphingomonas canadensis TaxID=1219257 RepID=A0ABW3HCC9_9SPHN|nr:helix-turn-helix domain-containing protein [Sphingomonas canadensis]MCW3838106.1 helix-turn-helix domain-containing protein [Sphingomonas canadensis]